MESALEERARKADGGAGLGAAILNGTMKEYLTDKIEVGQRPKG